MRARRLRGYCGLRRLRRLRSVGRPVRKGIVLVGSPGGSGQRGRQRSRGLAPRVHGMLRGSEAEGRGVKVWLRWSSRGIRRGTV
jgi:hypothetical protein